MDTAESLFKIYYRKQQGNVMGLGEEQSLEVSPNDKIDIEG